MNILRTLNAIRRTVLSSEARSCMRGDMEQCMGEIDKALKLLKQAGDNLDIRTNQEVRGLRFKVIQFLEEQNGH